MSDSILGYFYADLISQSVRRRYISTDKRLKLVNRTEPHITRQQEQPHQDLDEKFTFAEYDLDKKRWICPRKKPELPPDIKSVTIHFNQHRGLKIFEELFCILMNKIVFILRGNRMLWLFPKLYFFLFFSLLLHKL